MLDSSSTIGGAGTVNFEGPGTVTMDGTYDVTGATSGDIQGGDNIVVNFNGPVDSIGSGLFIEGGGAPVFNFNTPLVGTAGTIGNVELQAGTLNLGANDLNATTLTLYGTLSGTETITLSGALTGDGGTISGPCTVNADGGMSPGFVDYIILDGCTLNNAAGQTITTLGFEFMDGAVFNNLGTYTASTYEQFGQEPNSGARSSFNNQGSFIVDEANATNSVTLSAVAFNDDGGTVNVKEGMLILDGGGTSTSGSFTIESGATLQIGEDYVNPFTFGSGTTLSGAGSLSVWDYQDTVILAGTSTVTGPTTITSGTLQVDGSQPSSAVAVGVGPYSDNASTLTGTGTVGPITTTSGTISPGDSATAAGILTADGNVTLDSGSTFNVGFNGATAGAGYDQLNATGSVNLGGSTLTGSLGFTPTIGETFTIIQSTAPIVGTFKGLARGRLGDNRRASLHDQLCRRWRRRRRVDIDGPHDPRNHDDHPGLVGQPRDIRPVGDLDRDRRRPQRRGHAVGLGELPGGIDDPGDRPARPIRSGHIHDLDTRVGLGRDHRGLHAHGKVPG